MSAIYARHVLQIAELRSSVAAFVALWVWTELGIDSDPSPVRFSQSSIAELLGVHDRTVQRHWRAVRALFEEVAPNLWLPRKDRWRDPHAGLEPGKQPQFFPLPERLVRILLGLARLGQIGFSALKLFLPLIRRLRAARYNAERGRGSNAVSLSNARTCRWLGMAVPSLRRAIETLTSCGLLEVLFDGHRKVRGTWWLEPQPRSAAAAAPRAPEPEPQPRSAAAAAPVAPEPEPPTERSPEPPAKRSPSYIGGDLERESSTSRAREDAPPTPPASPDEPSELAADVIAGVAEELKTATWPEGSGRRGRLQDGPVLDGTSLLPGLGHRAAEELVSLGQLDSPEAAVAWLEQEAWGLRTADNPAGYFLALARSGETKPGEPSGLEAGWQARAVRERELRRRGEQRRQRQEEREALLPADPEEREAFLQAERDAQILESARAEHEVLMGEATDLEQLIGHGVERVREGGELFERVATGTGAIDLAPAALSALDEGARLIGEALQKAGVLAEATRDPWQDDEANQETQAEVIGLYEATKRRVAAAIARAEEFRAMKERARELALSPELERAKRALEERDESERQRERDRTRASGRRWLTELKGALGIRSRARR